MVLFTVKLNKKNYYLSIEILFLFFYKIQKLIIFVCVYFIIQNIQMIVCQFQCGPGTTCLNYNQSFHHLLMSLFFCYCLYTTLFKNSLATWLLIDLWSIIAMKRLYIIVLGLVMINYYNQTFNINCNVLKNDH